MREITLWKRGGQRILAGLRVHVPSYLWELEGWGGHLNGSLVSAWESSLLMGLAIFMMDEQKVVS